MNDHRGAEKIVCRAEPHRMTKTTTQYLRRANGIVSSHDDFGVHFFQSLLIFIIVLPLSPRLVSFSFERRSPLGLWPELSLLLRRRLPLYRF